MKISQKQLESVIALPGPKRYSHFVKVVADWETVWGLYQDGWALAATDNENRTVFPVWPAREYAELCVANGWENFEPTSMTLDEFMYELLPDLSDKGILPCIFYLPTDKGVVPTVEELLKDLDAELHKYDDPAKK